MIKLFQNIPKPKVYQQSINQFDYITRQTCTHSKSFCLYIANKWMLRIQYVFVDWTLIEMGHLDLNEEMCCIWIKFNIPIIPVYLQFDASYLACIDANGWLRIDLIQSSWSTICTMELRFVPEFALNYVRNCFTSHFRQASYILTFRMFMKKEKRISVYNISKLLTIPLHFS